MKKFILISSLLAAGTLAANATTILWTTNTSATGADDIIGLTQKSSSGGAQTLTFASATDVGSGSNVSLAYYIGSGRDWATEASFTATQINSALNTAITADTGLTVSDFGGSNKIYGTGHDTSTTLTFSNLEANTVYRFSFIFETRAAAGTFSVSTGSLVTSDDCSYYGVINGISSNDLSYLSDTVTSISTANNSTFYGASIVVTSNADGVVAFEATRKAGFSMIALTTIPEPSLFGLFAGTLALGLAGTRRRRNRAGTQK